MKSCEIMGRPQLSGAGRCPNPNLILGHRAVRRIISARPARPVGFCRLRGRVEQAAALAGGWRRLASEERFSILELRRHAGRWRGACRPGSAPFLLFVELLLVLD